ncbi:MAG: type II secretion system F family protein [Nocardioides sp.]
MKSLLAATLAGVLSALIVGVPAQAAENATSIAYVERTDEELQILVSVPADATVDTESVAVTIDGTVAPATAVPADDTTSVRRTAVLVIDTSNSMRGQRITAAQTAAQTFLETVPDDVYVGVVTFDSDVTAALDPTLDRDEARDVVTALDLQQQTRLYDGVQAGITMAGLEGQRQLLVLSDGADTSDTALEGVAAAISDADLLVNVVALEQNQKGAVGALETLAESGDGRVISADSGALSRAFSNEADVLARQVLVTAQVPSTVTAEEATVAVTLGSDVGDLSAEAFTPIGNAPAPVAPAVTATDQGLVLNSAWLYGGLAALGLGLLVVLVAIAPRQAEPLTGADLAAAYTARVTGVGRNGEDEAETTLVQASQTAEKMLGANKSLETRISERLDGAGNPFNPGEWVLLQVGVFILAGTIGLLLGGGNLILGVIFLFVGAVAPWMYLGIKRSRRRKKFESLLPETLQLISGSLSAGLSLAQAIDTVVKEGEDPVASEFRRALVETRLGVSLDDALEGIADRFDSKDFSWVIMAIRIQRQVGGNLAELLDKVAGTMREREYMRRQVAALAAEGKLSAWVLGGLPPGFMVYLLLTKRDFVMPMFTEPIGWLMLGGAVVLLSVGIFWMSRIVKVEV